MQPKNFKCNSCNRRFAKNNHLMSHSRIHTAENSFSFDQFQYYFECNYCRKLFKSKTYLREHIVKYEIERPHKCKTCTKTFLLQHNLHRHQKIHTDSALSCEFCKRNFYMKSHLRFHIEVHLKKQDIFKCSFCRKSFLFFDDLKKHKLDNHNGQFRCEFCNERFRFKCELIPHLHFYKNRQCCNARLIKYLSREVFECDFCGKKFSHKRNRLDHVKKFHTPPKHINYNKEDYEYKCEFCDKSFKYKFQLIPHLLIYKNKKCCNAKQARYLNRNIYNCELCNKKFLQKINLRKHIKVHDFNNKDKKQITPKIKNNRVMEIIADKNKTNPRQELQVIKTITSKDVNVPVLTKNNETGQKNLNLNSDDLIKNYIINKVSFKNKKENLNMIDECSKNNITKNQSIRIIIKTSKKNEENSTEKFVNNDKIVRTDKIIDINNQSIVENLNDNVTNKLSIKTQDNISRLMKIKNEYVIDMMIGFIYFFVIINFCYILYNNYFNNTCLSN